MSSRLRTIDWGWIAWGCSLLPALWFGLIIGRAAIGRDDPTQVVLVLVVAVTFVAGVGATSTLISELIFRRAYWMETSENKFDLLQYKPFDFQVYIAVLAFVAFKILFGLQGVMPIGELFVLMFCPWLSAWAVRCYRIGGPQLLDWFTAKIKQPSRSKSGPRHA